MNSLEQRSGDAPELYKEAWKIAASSVDFPQEIRSRAVRYALDRMPEWDTGYWLNVDEMNNELKDKAVLIVGSNLPDNVADAIEYMDKGRELLKQKYQAVHGEYDEAVTALHAALKEWREQPKHPVRPKTKTAKEALAQKYREADKNVYHASRRSSVSRSYLEEFETKYVELVKGKTTVLAQTDKGRELLKKLYDTSELQTKQLTGLVQQWQTDYKAVAEGKLIEGIDVAVLESAQKFLLEEFGLSVARA